MNETRKSILTEIIRELEAQIAHGMVPLTGRELESATDRILPFLLRKFHETKAKIQNLKPETGRAAAFRGLDDRAELHDMIMDLLDESDHPHDSRPLGHDSRFTVHGSSPSSHGSQPSNFLRWYLRQAIRDHERVREHLFSFHV